MIAVLMGGWSAERAVSLASGQAVCQALKAQKIPCFAFDVTKKTLAKLWQKNFDKAFIVMHGRGGEDGFIQNELDKRGLPYTGSGVSASKLAMDKMATKKIWQAKKIPTPKSVIYNNLENLPDFAMPWAVKPVLEGSSIGIHKITNKTQLPSAIADAKRFNSQIMIEQWVVGSEYTIAIVNGKALPIIELKTTRSFYNYAAKYNDNNTEYICPCPLPKEKQKQLQALALTAFSAVGASNWGRIDLMLDKTLKPFLLEVNTVPGMTSHSLVPMAAKALSIDFNQLVYQILKPS